MALLLDGNYYLLPRAPEKKFEYNHREPKALFENLYVIFKRHMAMVHALNAETKALKLF
jgi:hypothetical protein